VRELEQLGYVLPDKFVAGGMIVKLPPSWRNFTITLKHKKQKISVENLLASLDVEEKARATKSPRTVQCQCDVACWQEQAEGYLDYSVQEEEYEHG